MTEAPIDFLVAWFVSHCDEDWEHDTGVRVATLDNPGWSVDVRLEDTELEGHERDWSRYEDGEHWLHWRTTRVAFEARCGPNDLTLAIQAFKDFAQQAR